MSYFHKNGDENRPILSNPTYDALSPTADPDSDILMDDEGYDIKSMPHHPIKTGSIRANFIYFILLTAFNRACDNVVISYYTAILGDAGSRGLGILFIAQAISSILFAKAIVKSYGCKSSISIAHSLFSVLCISFYLATATQSSFQYIFIMVGSVAGGCGVSIWWTAQSEYYSKSCDLYYESMPHADLFSIRSDLASLWTMMYLGIDVSLKALATVISYYTSTKLLFICVACISIFTTVLGTYVIIDVDAIIPSSSSTSTLHNEKLAVMYPTLSSHSHGHGQGQGGQHVQIYTDSKKLIQEIFLFIMNDARMQLIAVFFIAYGITQAMLSNYIDGKVIAIGSKSGVTYIGILSAISTFTAASLSPVFNIITKRFSFGMHYLVFGACLCCSLSGLIVLHYTESQLGHHLSLIILYKCIWGYCRAVYENTFKVVITEYYHLDNRPLAFTIQVMVLGISCSVFLFIFPYVSREVMASICLLVGMLAFLAYGFSIKIHHSQYNEL